MAVSIRLRRGGTTKRPFYRIVATDSRSPRDGRFVEVLGHYHPLDNPAKVVLNEERLRHYLDTGARVSETIGSLLDRRGIALPGRPKTTPKSAAPKTPRPKKRKKDKQEKKAS